MGEFTGDNIPDFFQSNSNRTVSSCLHSDQNFYLIQPMKVGVLIWESILHLLHYTDICKDDESMKKEILTRFFSICFLYKLCYSMIKWYSSNNEMLRTNRFVEK